MGILIPRSVQRPLRFDRCLVRRTLDNMELKHFERAMSVMTTSGFLAIKYGSKAMMVTSKEKPKGGGAIIITSSCCAFLGAYADIAYSK